jgi:hypothetical protein
MASASTARPDLTATLCLDKYEAAKQTLAPATTITTHTRLSTPNQRNNLRETETRVDRFISIAIGWLALWCDQSSQRGNNKLLLNVSKNLEAVGTQMLVKPMVRTPD